MPIRQGSTVAKNGSTRDRRRRRRTTTPPSRSTPCTWNTDLAMSNPTTTTCPIALLPVHPSQLTLLPGWTAVHGIRSGHRHVPGELALPILHELVESDAKNCAPRPLHGVPAGRCGNAEGAGRRDPASDRRSAAKAAAAHSMSIESDERRQLDGRGASMIDRKPFETAQTGAASAKRRFWLEPSEPWLPYRNGIASAFRNRHMGKVG